VGACGAIGAAAVLLFTAAPAAAGAFLAMQAGGFVPWQGDAGYSLALQLTGSNAAARSRWGGEFEFRNFDSTIVGVSGVEVESYIVRGVWQYFFMPDRFLTPYVGFGLGVSIDVVDDDKVDRVRSMDTIGSTSAGLDGLFLAGLQMAIPGVDALSVYAEGRVGFGFAVYGRHDNNSVETENLGGGSGNLGLRFRF